MSRLTFAGKSLVFRISIISLLTIPGLIGAILLIYITSKEDKFLKKNLEGYKEYSEVVKYRLIPGIW